MSELCMPKKKVNQISVRFDEEIYRLLQTACKINQHNEGQLGRILIEWALPFYLELKTVEALNENDVDALRDYLRQSRATDLKARLNKLEVNK